MKHTRYAGRVFHALRPGAIARGLLLLLLATCGLRVAGEPVVMIGPEPPAAPQPESSVVTAVRAAGPQPRPSPFRHGSIALRPRFSFTLLEGDGIQARPGEPLTTTIRQAAAGAVLEFGSRWALDFGATRALYSNPAFRDTTDQTISLTGGAAYGSWSAQVYHAYAASTLPLVETGAQTKQASHSSVAVFNFGRGRRLSLDVTVEQRLQLPDQFVGSREWPVNTWLTYHAGPQLDFAVGAAGGYVAISPGPDLAFERPQARLTWRLRETVVVQVSGGQETRTVFSTHPVSLHRNVFTGSLELRPTRSTVISAGAERELAVSYFSRQLSENTKRTFQLHQRILQHWQLSAGLEHHDIAYLPVGKAAIVKSARDDTRDAFNVGFAIPFASRGLISLSYYHQDNDSNGPGYSFTSRQYIFETRYRY